MKDKKSKPIDGEGISLTPYSLLSHDERPDDAWIDDFLRNTQRESPYIVTMYFKSDGSKRPNPLDLKQ